MNTSTAARATRHAMRPASTESAPSSGPTWLASSIVIVAGKRSSPQDGGKLLRLDNGEAATDLAAASEKSARGSPARIPPRHPARWRKAARHWPASHPAKRLPPAVLNRNDTIGSPVWLSNPGCASSSCSPVTIARRSTA